MLLIRFIIFKIIIKLIKKKLTIWEYFTSYWPIQGAFYLGSSAPTTLSEVLNLHYNI